LTGSTPARFHVLIVDRSQESREVFRTALERRGWSTVEAAGAVDGLEKARRFRPQVIVLDVDDHADSETACQAFQHESQRQHAALVVLGAAAPAAGLDDVQIVPKPYHYGPLIRKIEQLCRQSLTAHGHE
jgi:CheY-like chemotaxis protein